jgi:FlaA1/EpsC-like NDP-sugar epimerase
MAFAQVTRIARGLAWWACLTSCAWWLAWALRYDFALPPAAWQTFWATLGGVVAIKLVIALALQNAHEWLRYVSFRDLVLLAATLALSSVGCVALLELLPPLRDLEVPASVYVLDFATSILMIGGARSLWRFQREHFWPLWNMIIHRRQFTGVLLVGANRSGVVLANQIHFHPKLRYRVVGFLDDDGALTGTSFGGMPVLGRLADVATVARRHAVKDILVLDGSLAGDTLRELLTASDRAQLRLRVIANVFDLLTTSGPDRRVALRPINIDDLLRRAPITLDDAALGELLSGQTVLVTGAGGSIGSEICRQVLRFSPSKLVLVERAENSLFQVHRELAAKDTSANIVPLVADVTDERRMRQVFDDACPHVVFHAAAHKHVPMMESNPSEAIVNNVFGTQLVADLCDEYDVRSFVFISTDKAVRPTSVMGLSKQLAERYVSTLAQTSETRYVVVRFGNVLGSAGSVVPIFQEQIRQGGPITITDREMRRFFMTIPEASQLVLQAGAMGNNGEILVLDMGAPVKIVDLARDLIHLSGMTEDDIEIVETGIRPGEKLYEELYFDDEQSVPTQHPKVRVAHHSPYSAADVRLLMEQLRALVLLRDPIVVRNRLRELCPEFGAVHEPPVVPLVAGVEGVA